MKVRSLSHCGFSFLVLLIAVASTIRAQADGISVSPSEGVGGTPFTVTVTGFVPEGGTYPYASVSLDTYGYFSSCPGNSDCVLTGSMPLFHGRHVLEAVMDNDGSRRASTSFKVFDAEMMINRSCGTNGSKVLMTGNHFNRNSYISAYTSAGLSDSNGQIVVQATLNEGNGPIYIVMSDGFNTVSNLFVVGPGGCDSQAGQLLGTPGPGTIRPPNGSPQPLRPNGPVRPGDELHTGAGGSADLLLTDGTRITMPQNSGLSLGSHTYNPADHQNDGADYGLLEGAFRYTSGLISKQNDNVRATTPSGFIGIRGTEFITRRAPCSSTQEVYLIHGQLAVKPLASAVTNIVDAPASIFFDATNVIIAPLTQAAYDVLKDEISQTNPVTFATWQVQYFGCTNNNAAAMADADPDGDGQNNYAEFLAHTDPTAGASVFKFVSAAREGDGVRLVWQTHGGVTNVVQAAPSLNGNYSNLSSDMIIPGEDDVITNYLDEGIITNTPARFYRIRLLP